MVGAVSRDREDGDVEGEKVAAPVAREVDLWASGVGPVEGVEGERSEPSVASAARFTGVVSSANTVTAGT